MFPQNKTPRFHRCVCPILGAYPSSLFLLGCLKFLCLVFTSMYFNQTACFPQEESENPQRKYSRQIEWRRIAIFNWTGWVAPFIQIQMQLNRGNSRTGLWTGSMSPNPFFLNLLKVLMSMVYCFSVSALQVPTCRCLPSPWLFLVIVESHEMTSDRCTDGMCFRLFL